MEQSYTDTLLSLAQKDVLFATVFDLGCADGHFFVDHFLKGLFQEAVPVNIDPNTLYENSLCQIKEVFGGHYRIAAASDTPGEIELTTSIHPYWSSLRPSGDIYWERINKLTSSVQRVPAMTLDNLVAELKVTPPYLLKLDVQGAEVQALRGAHATLADTSVVICEADVADFQDINRELVGANFDLYDITFVNRLADQTLAWFYPVYINRRLAHLKPRGFWRESNNDSVIQQQVKRRQEILDRLSESLPQIRAARTARRLG